MTIYLYVKTHNKTGLKYLGQTIRDPFKYKGSGKRWVNHIKKHGYDVTTTIIHKCNNKFELKEFGIYYSNLWNVVESAEWANCTIESGSGGLTFPIGSRIKELNPMYGKKEPCSEKRRLAIIKSKQQQNYERYKLAITLMLSGKKNAEITKELQIGKVQLSEIKTGKSNIFKAYPELGIFKNKLSKLDNTPGKIPDIEIYEIILSKMLLGFTDYEIKKYIRINHNRKFSIESIEKLRNKTHRIFKIYPVLCQFK